MSKLAESSFQPCASQDALENCTVYKGQTLSLREVWLRGSSSLLKELPRSSLQTDWMSPGCIVSACRWNLAARQGSVAPDASLGGN